MWVHGVVTPRTRLLALSVRRMTWGVGDFRVRKDRRGDELTPRS